MDWIQLAGVMSPNDYHYIHHFQFISAFAISKLFQSKSNQYENFLRGLKKNESSNQKFVFHQQDQQAYLLMNGGGGRLEGRGG